MTSVLKIIFQLPGGKTLTWSIADPQSNLTQTQVETLANNILARSAILVNGLEPESFKEAYIYQTNKLELS